MAEDVCLQANELHLPESYPEALLSYQRCSMCVATNAEGLKQQFSASTESQRDNQDLGERISQGNKTLHECPLKNSNVFQHEMI